MTCLIYELDIIVLFLRIVAFKGCYFVGREGQPVFVPALKAVTWVCPLPVRVGCEVGIRDTEPGFSPNTNVFVVHYHPTSDPYCIFNSYTTDAMYFWQLTPSNTTPSSASVLRQKCLICFWPTCCPVFCCLGAFAKQWRKASVGFKCLP